MIFFLLLHDRYFITISFLCKHITLFSSMFYDPSWLHLMITGRPLYAPIVRCLTQTPTQRDELFFPLGKRTCDCIWTLLTDNARVEIYVACNLCCGSKNSWESHRRHWRRLSNRLTFVNSPTMMLINSDHRQCHPTRHSLITQHYVSTLIRKL